MGRRDVACAEERHRLHTIREEQHLPIRHTQLAEQTETYALDRRKIADQAALIAQEAQSRIAAVEHEATAEALRLAKMEERILANPNAARYDFESAQLRVAEQLAGNSRAVVSLGAGDVFPRLLLARETDPGAGSVAGTTPEA